MDATIQFIGAFVAAAASLMAVLLGIDQLSQGTRLRGLEATLRGAAAGSPGDQPMQEVLTSLHRDTMARLVAREAVPLRNFLLSGVIVATNFAWSARIGYQVGPSIWVDVSGLVVPQFTTALFSIHLIHLVGERLRIRRWYVEGRTPLRAYTDYLARMEGGGRLIFALAIAFGGLGPLIVFAMARSIVAPSGWTVGLLLVSLTAVVLNFASTQTYLRNRSDREPRNRDDSLKPTWAHPRAASSQSSALKPQTNARKQRPRR